MSLLDFDNKLTDKGRVHSYLPLYSKLLKHLKDKNCNILEIGVREGGSIKLWKDFFCNSTIYGIDIEDNVKIDELKNNNKIILFLDNNAYDFNFIKKNFIDNEILFDFILDDGPHTLKSQIQFIKLYSNLLKDNGILIIEDVSCMKNLEILKTVPHKNLKKFIKTYDLRKNKNRSDDIVFTIDKTNN